MQNKKTLASTTKLAFLVTAYCAALAGCGGGGGGGASDVSDAADLSSAAKRTGFAAVKPGANDWVMYVNNTINYSVNPAVTWDPTYLMRTYTGATQDGHFGYVDTTSDTGSYFRKKTAYNVDPTSAVLSSFSADDGLSCSYSPGYTAVFALAPGVERLSGSYSTATAWNESAQSTCHYTAGAAFNGTATSVGSIPTVEAVTAGGVQYQAAKETYTTTDVPDASTGRNPSQTKYTCWRDTALGRNVKCEVSFSVKASATSDYKLQYMTTFELVGYKLQGASAKQPQASQFAGTFKLTYGGSKTGTCDLLRINTNGVVSGSCPITSASTVSGQVQQDGTINFKTAGDATFNGNLGAPTGGTGHYTTTDGGSGTWTLSHD